MEYIVVGLGNPGKEYEETRHNIGRMMLEYFRSKHQFPQWEQRGELKALLSRGTLGEKYVSLLGPDNYMNNSGESVVKYMQGVDESTLIVVHDDIDLPVGTLRISYNRGAGGHNGIRSIEKQLATQQFVRIRVGIAPISLLTGTMRKPRGKQAVQNFVLKKFGYGDKKHLEETWESVAGAIESVITDGVGKAMNMYN